MTVRFILASASPARLETLRRAGVEPEVIVSGVDESVMTADTPAELVQVLADAKTAAVVATLDSAPGAPGALVLGCDSMLEVDGAALGKPGSAAEAVQRWRQMRGRTGVLHTGHCLYDGTTGRTARASVPTTVQFADASDDEIDWYVATDEPLHVAGAFTIDGLGGWFVEAIDGSSHNVIGLALPALRAMLHELGYTLRDIGYQRR